MQYIQRDRLIHIEWSIFRGTSDVPEDFSRALVKMFLIGNNEKYLLTAAAQGGTLLADLPEGLPEGAYSLEALWVKNYGNLLPHRQPLTPGGEPVCLRRPGQRPNAHAFLHPHDHRFNDRCLMRSRKDYVFALTDYPSEETYTGDSGEATVRCASSVATYGYDGLSAYQIAVMRGDFNGTEGEYLESLKYELEAATDEKLGGIKASAKTDNETVEAKIGPDGKLYVPAAASEELKAATETTLGGIRAATKTSLETQEVKIDPETGKLYTLPGGEGGVEIVNNPDDEDLHSVEKSQDEHVLQFADKEYNASAFSGLGRVYLRKNLSSGKNVLTQAMMNKANTRYIIQYDYDLDGGTIEVPEGCTFDFQGGSLGNGTVVLNKTKLSGRIRFALNCNFTGKSSNNELNVEWFGAVGDGETDSTQAFKNVLKIAYNSLENTGNSYNKRSAVINIGVGSYKVINSIIDEDSELLYGAFLFKGQGYVSSIIKYEGDANTYLFDNKNIFAYTSFKDIGFLGNNENNFMHLYSAGDPNITQSIIFDRVRFGSFKTLMNAEGSTMCSEVNFINCKIVGFSESSVIFIMNNLNAVNWRFWGTEIEQTNGVVFRLLKGSFISLYSGSFIPFKGTFIEVPEEADNATFWYTNSPQVCMYSCRFELRGLSKLLSVRNPAYLGFSFYSCNMGGSNITEEADTYQIEALSNNSRNQLRIHFVDCANFENYKMKSVADESSYAYFTELTFDRCIINIDEFISSMYCTNINNSEGYPKVYIDGVLYINKSKAKLRNDEKPTSYIKKSSADDNFNSNIPASETVTYNSFFRKYAYAGAVTFNIIPTQDIRLYIINSESTVIYYDITIKKYTKFNQTIFIDKFITEDDYVKILITNKNSSEACIIQGHAEVHSTLYSSHILMLKSNLSSLNAVQKGMITYDSVSKTPAIWDGVYWKNADGFTVGKKNGKTEDRPTLVNDDIGFCFFDKTLMKPIWYQGNGIWGDINGEKV